MFNPVILRYHLPTLPTPVAFDNEQIFHPDDFESRAITFHIRIITLSYPQPNNLITLSVINTIILFDDFEPQTDEFHTFIISTNMINDTYDVQTSFYRNVPSLIH